MNIYLGDTIDRNSVALFQCQQTIGGLKLVRWSKYVVAKMDLCLLQIDCLRVGLDPGTQAFSQPRSARNRHAPGQWAQSLRVADGCAGDCIGREAPSDPT